MKTPHLCPICKKEVKQRPGCCTPIYCCKKHWMQDPNSSYHRKESTMNNGFNFEINVTKTAESNYGCDSGNVTFSGTPTLRDLVDWVLARGEWGYIGLYNRGPHGELPEGKSLFGDPHVEYKDDRILVGTFDSNDYALDPFMDHVVSSVEWSGGWSRSDYLVKVVQANDLPREKPKCKKEVPSEVGQAINEMFK